MSFTSWLWSLCTNLSDMVMFGSSATGAGSESIGCVQVGVRHPGHIITTLSGRPPLQHASSQGDKQLPPLRSRPDLERASDDSPDAQETVEVCGMSAVTAEELVPDVLLELAG